VSAWPNWVKRPSISSQNTSVCLPVSGADIADAALLIQTPILRIDELENTGINREAALQNRDLPCIEMGLFAAIPQKGPFAFYFLTSYLRR
jgi:hypothetical protein